MCVERLVGCDEWTEDVEGSKLRRILDGDEGYAANLLAYLRVQ